MASITIRNLGDGVKHRLRIRAAKHGRSVEEEARVILRAAVEPEEMSAKGLGTAIHELFKPFGGVELEIPPREPMREPPRDFGMTGSRP
ncbi:FitA-like ribbon-helix-helix domain-containing protein [Candidatus Palauibacter sp.]|uniref:FitA-like ribbon-helix-helix domain-containing protein n=1 Tax=Candidatus Palauibacter sp. TaxID=3101350 RepID=UPI003B0190F1